jgi:hypothetical protein
MMKNILWINISLLFVVIAFPFKGQAFTGKQYVETCQELKADINSQSISSAVCISYMMGVLNTRTEIVTIISGSVKMIETGFQKERDSEKNNFMRGKAEGLKGLKSGYCVNENLFTIHQAVLIALKYLKKNPAELSYSAVGSILTSLSQKFPCSE